MNEVFEFFYTVVDNWEVLLELSTGQHKYSELFKSLEF